MSEIRQSEEPSVPSGYAEAASAPIVIVTGPTATGKTRLAVALARQFGGEILSVDSRQVYRGMDIGTGKDLTEYSEGGAPVRCHLLDIVDAGEPYDLFHFLQDARNALVDMHSRRALPILCGGTPLYLAALLDGYDLSGGPPDLEAREELSRKPLPELVEILRREASPELFGRIDLTQERRVIRGIEIARSGVREMPPKLTRTLILAPKYSRAEVRERIRIRLDERLKGGLVEEVRMLHEKEGLSFERLDWFGLEYRYVGRYLAGECSYDEMHDALLTQIRQFAKRQDIWFRKLEREGHLINWIPAGEIEAAAALVRDFLKQ